MKFRINLTVLLMILCTLYSFSQSKTISVPEGLSIKIDGIINLTEWKNAIMLPLQGGESVYFQMHKDTLFVAVKGKSGGFCSLALGNQTEFRILHSSTGLITAKYKKVNNKWQLIYDFKGPLNSNGKEYSRGPIRQTQEYRKANLNQFYWYANLVEMGNPSETEYAIPLTNINTNELFISVVFFQIKAQEKIAKLPFGLNDDCLNRELISGSAKAGLNFKPREWIKINNL